MSFKRDTGTPPTIRADRNQAFYIRFHLIAAIFHLNCRNNSVITQISNDNDGRVYKAYKAVKYLQHFSVMKCLPWYMNRWNVAGMKQLLERNIIHDKEHK